VREIAADGDADNRCLSAWRLTDPPEDKDGILSSKDPLLEGSCSWTFHNRAFTQWWNNDESRILWRHGDLAPSEFALFACVVPWRSSGVP